MSTAGTDHATPPPGPLNGLRALELGGIGPGPFCGMLLADLGVEVIRVERPADAGTEQREEVLNRGRRSLTLDLKSDSGREIALDIAARCDIVFEGFRPGVAERLGVGPHDCAARNLRIVYGRMTGWGQDGPLSSLAGHDINYIAMTGALDAIGERGGPPVAPLNLLGDFGGGGAYLALGLISAVWEAARSGHGQVVDAAIVDGTSSLMAMLLGMRSTGRWEGRRGENLLDGGAHFYGVYESADGRYLAAGPIEPQFYAQFLEALGLEDPPGIDRLSPAQWQRLRGEVERAFLGRTREEWLEIFSTRDACVTPVLTIEEARDHPHNHARGYLQEHEGVLQPGAAPRFSRSQAQGARSVPHIGEHTDEVLRWIGRTDSQIDALRSSGVIG
ncbi:CaiB/BaiF CoA-transferase family protein [Aeromicrobium sp. PE09-221]|uniref:CaiB/BaiF CoA transferase family protein n=1 Tax=Aeromicrobium sp. PE09-221 TaxID=1898043 RepID=UPI000B3E71E2|nr:CaiB/BaiF CoA-transferase family protein [Aeromicrobium sp. PE09-221]